jgi:nucleotide-binding universal stress UspA family protein
MQRFTQQDFAAIQRWEDEGGRALAREQGLRAQPRGQDGRLHAVLVPVDLTPSSDRVLGRLSLLPLAEDAQVTLLHVVSGSLAPREQSDAERDAHRALAQEARYLRMSLPRSVSILPLVKLGSIAKEIAACAAKLEADLVVMGRGPGKTLRDALLGSTAERVMRQARLPVLVVRLAPRAFYRRPSVALDLEQTADEVVRRMLLVLPPPRPRVMVIHAHDVPYGKLIYPSLPIDQAQQMEEEFRLKATHALGRLLSTSLARAGVRSEDAPSWKTHVRHGSPRSVVETAVRTNETDLLVLGTRGHAGAAYALLGTVAGDILRASKCDVLVVPSTP